MIFRTYSLLALSWEVKLKHRYPKNRFSPARILHDPAYQNLNKSDKNIYLLLCRRSFLVKKSPTRRYSVWTYNQIGKQVNLSGRQVQRIIKKLMAEMLIYRWYAGDSGSTTSTHKARPPRYEIPASKEMIAWWRRNRKIQKTTFN